MSRIYHDNRDVNMPNSNHFCLWTYTTGIRTLSKFPLRILPKMLVLKCSFALVRGKGSCVNNWKGTLYHDLVSSSQAHPGLGHPRPDLRDRRLFFRPWGREGNDTAFPGDGVHLLGLSGVSVLCPHVVSGLCFPDTYKDSLGV